MNPQKDPFSEYPQQVRASTERPTSLYVRQSGYYAVHYRQPDMPAPGAALLLNDGAIAVFQGEPDETQAASMAGTLGPVYGLQPSGPPAVPTGLVFVRFAEGVAAESRRKEIDRAGYEVAESLSYAPGAAWLRARSGRIADALAGIPALEKMLDVENVEPQMLMASARRE
jgi:hypothetical protein